MDAKRLVNYNAMTQHMGTWLLGYNWNIYGCGTYSEPVSPFRAEALLKRFMDRLDRKLKSTVSYFAVMERRHSGCGMSPIPLHWHFLAACPCPEGMVKAATELWQEKFGTAKIARYDRSQNAAFYTCKLADHANGTILDGNLDRLRYEGPTDLIAAAHFNPYVPDRLKDKVFGNYLVMRDTETQR